MSRNPLPLLLALLCFALAALVVVLLVRSL
jgi:hypothetical protein